MVLQAVPRIACTHSQGQNTTKPAEFFASEFVILAKVVQSRSRELDFIDRCEGSRKQKLGRLGQCNFRKDGAVLAYERDHPTVNLFLDPLLYLSGHGR